jgi:IrrE N-terminal-like domain
MGLQSYIDRLEEYSAHCGSPVVRQALALGISGRLESRRIVLRAGLTPEQQVLTLVHELTHLIAHCAAAPELNRTVCEYEAEAVERWVGAELGVAPYDSVEFDVSSVTDDLLACSVVRVRFAASTLVLAARGRVTNAARRRGPGSGL